MPPKKGGNAAPSKKTKEAPKPQDDESDASFKDIQDETQEASDQDDQKDDQAASSNTGTRTPATRPRSGRAPKTEEEIENERKTAKLRRDTAASTTRDAKAFMDVNMPCKFHQDKTTMPGTRNSLFGYIIESFLAWATAGFPPVAKDEGVAVQTAASQHVEIRPPQPLSPSPGAGVAPIGANPEDFDNLPEEDFSVVPGDDKEHAADKGKGKGKDSATAKDDRADDDNAASSGNDQTKRPHSSSQQATPERPEKSIKLADQPVLPNRPFWPADAKGFKFTPATISGSQVTTRAGPTRRRRPATTQSFEPDMQPYQERLRQVYQRVQTKAADAVIRTGGEPNAETMKVLDEATDFLIDVADRLDRVVVVDEDADGDAGKDAKGDVQGAAQDAVQNAGDEQDGAGNGQEGAVQDAAGEPIDPEDEQPRPREGKRPRRGKGAGRSKKSGKER